MLRQMLIFSALATVTLCAQVANLIASAIVADRTALSVIIVTVLIEVVAFALIMVLFNPASEFLKSAAEVVSGRSTTASTRGGRSGATTKSATTSVTEGGATVSPRSKNNNSRSS